MGSRREVEHGERLDTKDAHSKFRQGAWSRKTGIHASSFIFNGGQAAAFVALQAVRSAASYALAILTGRLTDDEDTVAALWHAVPLVRVLAVLPAGADVLALHDDLTLYAYTIDDREAHDVAGAADVFCAWALAVSPGVTETETAPIQSLST